MNLEKEIGNSLEFMTNGGTSEIHRSDDGTIVARPTPVRMGATGMDLQPPIRRELSQAEPQTLEQTKKDIVPTLVGLPAGAAAATLGTLQDIAGLIYGGAKAMGAEGHVVHSPEDLLALDIKKICSRKGPTVLDVRIDVDEIPPIGVRTQVLSSEK